MKRIILGIYMLLMLVQNSFATTDAEYNKMIANESDLTWKQMYRCANAAVNHKKTSSPSICLKAIDAVNKNPKVIKEGAQLELLILNTGTLYSYQGDKLNAYKYYMKSAKLGDLQAQKNLNILCKESPWACK